MRPPYVTSELLNDFIDRAFQEDLGDGDHSTLASIPADAEKSAYLLMKESGVVNRLSDTTQNALINIVTIFFGLAGGSKLMAEKFLQLDTLGILLLGLVAFAIGTTSGLLMAKLMNIFSKNKVNPLIGSAGVSAVPMAARVSNKVGLESDPHNFLLMHAMGPNVAGVIGSAIAAGIMIQFLG